MKNKRKKEVVSTQDQAGLATRRVSSACGGVVVGTSRRGGGILLLLPLLLFPILKTLCNTKQTPQLSLKHRAIDYVSPGELC